MKALKRLISYLVCFSFSAVIMLTAPHATEAESVKVEGLRHISLGGLFLALEHKPFKQEWLNVELYFSETAQSITNKVKEKSVGLSQADSAFHYQIGPITTSGAFKLTDVRFTGNIPTMVLCLCDTAVVNGGHLKVINFSDWYQYVSLTHPALITPKSLPTKIQSSTMWAKPHWYYYFRNHPTPVIDS